VALLLERDGVGFEEEVEDTVDEGDVEGYEQKNRFLNKHLKWPKQVAIHNLFEINLVFIHLRMNGPILAFIAKLFGFPLQKNWRISFRNKD